MHMEDDKLNFQILLRKPHFPVIIITENDILPALNISKLKKICFSLEPSEDSKKIKIIDCSGEEFWYLTDKIVLIPGFMVKNWTKKQIIELFNHSRTAREKNIQYSLKSLPNKRLPTIVTEIYNLLSHKKHG